MSTIFRRIQIKRGNESNRLSVTPAEGELLYTKDTNRLYVGDGNTAGGKELSGSTKDYNELINKPDLAVYERTTDVDVKLDNKADKSTTYTKTETDSKYVTKYHGQGRSATNASIVLKRGDDSNVSCALPVSTTGYAGIITGTDRAKIDKLTTSGDGTKYLSDDGSYKTVSGGGTALYSITGQNTDGAMTQKATTDALSNKVDKVSGKGLSTNDYTTTEKTKLSGIATGATKNATDVQLRDRATHTGTQAISTVTGLQTALDGKASTTHIHDTRYYTKTEIDAKFNAIMGEIRGMTGWQ